MVDSSPTVRRRAGLLLLCGASRGSERARVRCPTCARCRAAFGEAPTLEGMSTPRHPSSSDEELLEAETSAILAELTDAQRLLRIQDELRNGFDALGRIGKAVSVFGSARTPRDHPRYEHARELCRRLGHEGFAIITGGGPGIMEAA